MNTGEKAPKKCRDKRACDSKQRRDGAAKQTNAWKRIVLICCRGRLRSRRPNATQSKDHIRVIAWLSERDTLAARLMNASFTFENQHLRIHTTPGSCAKTASVKACRSSQQSSFTFGIKEMYVFLLQTPLLFTFTLLLMHYCSLFKFISTLSIFKRESFLTSVYLYFRFITALYSSLLLSRLHGEVSVVSTESLFTSL
ncbi:hypothetical protein RB195_024108 [Necator americanus]|uniref:Uncharacterized protein n=1 Tax=Necator americanus TaxID=51031 RepID=A0ABR1ELZ5_NECAM